MPSPSTSKKGTNIIMRQGQTASIYGNDPNTAPEIKDDVRDLKP
jgi:hypothetical protein